MTQVLESCGQWAESCPCHEDMTLDLDSSSIRKVLENLAGVAYGDLLQKHYPLLKPEQWSVVVDDFEKGKALGLLEFNLKFDWTLRLPWKLALLGHHDHGLARRELQAIASEFDSQPAELQKHHHRKLWLSCQCVAYAACFRFVQITERSYEAAHSLVKRRAPPNAKGATISLTLRLLDLACDIKLEPELLCRWLKCLTTHGM